MWGNHNQITCDIMASKLLPKYKRIHGVEAFRVGRIEGHRIFAFDDEEIYVDVDSSFITRYPLNTPGYYVRLPNGVQKWIPLVRFEERFALI